MYTNNKLLIMISGVIILILITIGVSYAYFTANLTGGEDSTTITVTGGTMNIIYNGGSAINVANIIPDNNPAATKTFTVTGNNTTDVEMMYKISLVVESNTFSEDALKYKLISVNSDNNGKVAPSITTLTNIGSGSKTIKLGVGEFSSPTGGNKVHTYNLEIYFPNAAHNQNIDQEKEIKSYIKIENYKNTLADLIIEQGEGTSTIESKGNPNFGAISTTADSGLYAALDEYGISYYYRGERSLLNNNLIFGGFQWKIIRINGDGSVRVIYNGTKAHFDTNGTMNTIGTNTIINETTYSWNTQKNDAKYSGYMYGGANGVASTSRNGTISTAATYNQTNSNSKVRLDAWYLANISGKPFENQIVDNIFCNDRQLQSEVGGAATGPGYGNTGTTTHYAAYYRLATNKAPSLKCVQKNDRFTKNDILLGNKSLTYPVGLVTADEVAMAGIIKDKDNLTNYLYANQYYWTFTPSYMMSTGSNRLCCIGAQISDCVVDTATLGLRAVINLTPNLVVTGEGSATNPYRVEV